MRYPVLLKGKSLEAKAALRPASLQVTRKVEPPGTASMQLLPTDAAVQVGDWVSIDTPQGYAGVYVVTGINEATQTGIRTVSLQEAVCLLRDSVLFEAYNESQESRSARTVLGDLMDAQQEKVWKLGGVAFTEAMPWTFNGTTVWAGIQSVLDCLDGYQLRMDYSSLPFVLHVEKRATVPSAEMRMNRNMMQASIKVDRSDMFTRLYPVGASNLHLSEQYIEKNADKFGIISKTETVGDISDEGQLRAWARARLERCCMPVVSVDITGRELSERTGLDIDRLKPGKLCRVHFEEYGDIIQRIEEINFTDVINRPEECRVTIANKRQNVARVVANLQKQGGGGGRRQSQLEEVIKKYIKETDKGFELVAERIGPLDSDEARMIFDYDRIKTAVTASKKNSLGEWIVDSQSSIEQTAYDITLKVDTSSVTLENGKLTVANATLDVPSIIAQSVDAAFVNALFSDTNVLTAKSIVADGIGAENNFYFQNQEVSSRKLNIVTDFTQASNLGYGAKASTTAVTLLETEVGGVQPSIPDYGAVARIN